MSNGPIPVDDALRDELVDLLQSPTGSSTDDGPATELVALITSAIRDENPRFTLAQISSAVAQTGSARHLDALYVVPLLVRSIDGAAREILDLLGECGNVKEVVIAAEEALERLIGQIQSGEDDRHMDEDGKPAHATVFNQIDRLLSLYNSSIPRMKLRRKTPSETLRPLFSYLESAIELASPSFSRLEGRNIIQTISRLVVSVMKWVREQPSIHDDGESIDLLKSLLFSTLTSLATCICAEISQRQFEASNPRLVIRSAVDADWEGGHAVMDEAVTTATSLNYDPKKLIKERSLGALILFAHWSRPTPIPPNELLAALLPLLISSIQTNIALDETLSILLTSLTSLQTSQTTLDPDLAAPLASLLAPLASAHPSPPTRHLVFRLLAMLLARSPPPQHAHLLHELLADSPFPQMRAAAVGLLKDAVLAALRRSGTGVAPADLFGSPALLQTFGRIVLRPDPPDLFSPTPPPLQEFLDSPEPARLVECLSFYYVLLLRDTQNHTGVSDHDNLRSVEAGLLAPLRSALQTWMTEQDDALDVHASMPLAALETALERVGDAREKLGTKDRVE